MRDQIHIRNLECYGYTGVLSEEQRLGQRFRVDLRLGVDLSAAARSDDLADTVNYADIVTIARDTIRQQPFKLIEALAFAIATQLLALPRIEQVEITLTKPHAPIPDFSGEVAVSLTLPPEPVKPQPV